MTHRGEEKDDFLLVMAGPCAKFPVFAHDDGRRFGYVGVFGEELISQDEGGLGHELIYGLDDGRVNQD
jgi:hypothetical protein